MNSSNAYWNTCAYGIPETMTRPLKMPSISLSLHMTILILSSSPRRRLCEPEAAQRLLAPIIEKSFETYWKSTFKFGSKSHFFIGVTASSWFFEHRHQPQPMTTLPLFQFIQYVVEASSLTYKRSYAISTHTKSKFLSFIFQILIFLSLKANSYLFLSFNPCCHNIDQCKVR